MNALAYVRVGRGRAARARRSAVKSAPAEVAEKIEKLARARARSSRRRSPSSKRKVAMGGGAGGRRRPRRACSPGARDIPGGKALAVKVDVGDAATLRELAEKLRDKLGEAVVLVGAPGKDKAKLVLTVSKAPDRALQGRRPHQGHRADGRRLRRRAPRHGAGRRHRDGQARRGAREPLRAPRVTPGASDLPVHLSPLARGSPARGRGGRASSGRACASARLAASIRSRRCGATRTASRSNCPSAPASTAMRSGTASLASITTSGLPSTQQSPPRPSSTPLPNGSARTATPRRAASDFELREHPPRGHGTPCVPPPLAAEPLSARYALGGAVGQDPVDARWRPCETLHSQPGRRKPWQDGAQAPAPRATRAWKGRVGGMMIPERGGFEARMTEAKPERTAAADARNGRQRPLRDPSEPRQGRHGRGVPRVRPDHPAARRAEDRARRVAHARRRRGAAPGAAARPLGEPPERLPRPRPRAQPVRADPRDGVHHRADAPHAHPSQEGPGRVHGRRVPAHRARRRVRRRGHPRAGARARGPQARQRHGDDQPGRLVRQGDGPRLRLRQGARARLAPAGPAPRPTAARPTT